MSILDQNKRFELYFDHSSDQRLKQLLELRDFVVQNKLDTLIREDSLWSLIILVFDEYYLDEKTNSDLAMEKSFYCLFDVEEARRLSKDLVNWLSSLSIVVDVEKVGVDAEIGKVGNSLSVDIKSKISDLGLNSKVITKIEHKYGLLNSEDRIIFSQELSKVSNNAKELHYQLKLIASFLKIYPETTLFSNKETVDLILSESEIEDDKIKINLAYSLREFMNYDRGLDVAGAIYEFLRIIEIQKKEQYAWEDAFFLSIYLFMSFSFFHRMHWERQKFWLQYYAIRALTVGVDVKDILKKELYYETNNVLDYVSYDTLFYQALAMNNETLPINKIDGGYYTSKEVIIKYFSKTGDKFEDGYLREQFIGDLVGNSPAKESVQRILREYLYIYSHLKTVDLIEKNSGSEVSELDMYINQLERLLVWWIDGELWNLIVKYYTEREDKRYVPLQDFLQHIRKNEDLNLDNTVEKLLKFDAFLQEHKILNEKENILEFHESDNQFHWNKDLLT